MQTGQITASRLSASVIAVPPLARSPEGHICATENRRIIRYLEQGGVSTLLYGGNAVLYHIRLSEFSQLLGMLSDTVAESTLVIPSVGPAYGFMIDQLEILRDHAFPSVMVLPQSEVVDQVGVANAVRRFAEAYGKPVVLYIKHDRWISVDLIGRLVRDGLISWIKYAVVRENPVKDDYLREIVAHVPSEMVVSGIGEQPAIVHMKEFEVGSFTSGCVCVAPKLSMKMLDAVKTKDFATAESIREQFRPLEDLRNRINPIRVLHSAVAGAGIAQTGPIQPLLSNLTDEQASEVAKVALVLRNAQFD